MQISAYVEQNVRIYVNVIVVHHSKYGTSTILKLGICKRQHLAELPTKGYLIFWEIHLQIIKLFRLLNYWNSAGFKRDSSGSKWVNSTAISLLSQRPNSIMCGCSIEASRNESCFHWIFLSGCHSSDSFSTWILTTRIAGMDFHWWSSAGCCLRKGLEGFCWFMTRNQCYLV